MHVQIIAELPQLELHSHINQSQTFSLIHER
nr:MAG TPA: adenosine deaminase [Caudoviricetes sp.]